MRVPSLLRHRVVAGFLVLGACAALVISTTARPAAQGDARERTVFVTALDRMDNPVEGLGVADIVVREDGVRRETLRVSRAIEPMDVAVLVDNASSSSGLIPRVREGLRGFIAAMTPRNAVALIALADRPTILVDYTTSPEALLAGVGRLFTMDRSGMTLLDALIETANGLRRREAPRAAVVPIVTDGIEFTNHRYRDVLDAVTRSGAAVYPVTVGQFPITLDDVVRDRAQVLDAAPDATGGRRFSLLSTTAIESTLDKLARLLNSQYKVVYSRPETLIPPEKIEVSSPRPDVTVLGTPARAAGGSVQ